MNNMYYVLCILEKFLCTIKIEVALSVYSE